MKVDYLIVGAGYAGCVLAERLATQLGKKVLLMDRRNHVGGNAYDYRNEHGILVHKYGPHIFHTNARRIFDYLSAFTDWRPYYHHVLGMVDGKEVPIPFNLNSIYRIFSPTVAEAMERKLLEQFKFGSKVPILKLREEMTGDLQFLGEFIYQNVFYGYTTKQWELTPEQLSPAVTARVPVVIGRDDRYFQDAYQAMPTQGYTPMFGRMLDHPNIMVLLNADYRDVAGDIQYERMVFTGPIDEFFGYEHGELPYRSLRFDLKTYETERYQNAGTVNYPNDYPWTRITEQKWLTGDVNPKSTVLVEYPQAYVRGENDAYYPIPNDANKDQYAKYAAMAETLKGKVYFAGRLADYQYYNMDQVVARALALFEKELCP